MNNLKFSYKQFTNKKSVLEGFTDSDTAIPPSVSLDLSQRTEEDITKNIELFKFNMIKPGHTFRELNTILQKAYLPWFGQSKMAKIYANMYLGQGYADVFTLLGYHESIDPLMDEYLIVRDYMFKKGRDLGLLFPYSAGLTKVKAGLGDGEGSDKQLFTINCIKIKPAPGKGQSIETVTFHPDAEIKDFVVYIDLSTQDSAALNDKFDFAASNLVSRKPIKPFIDRVARCIERYEYEFFVSQPKKVNEDNDCKFKIKKFLINGRYVPSSDIKIKKSSVINGLEAFPSSQFDNTGQLVDPGDGNIVFKNQAGISLFKIMMKGKIETLSIQYGGKRAPGLQITENTSVILSEDKVPENKEIHNYVLSSFNDYPEYLTSLQLDYYLRTHQDRIIKDGYFGKTTDYPTKIRKSQEHWEEIGRDLKLPWSPLFAGCDPPATAVPPSPAAKSKVYFGDYTETEINKVKAMYGTDADMTTDPDLLEFGIEPKCMLELVTTDARALEISDSNPEIVYTDFNKPFNVLNLDIPELNLPPDPNNVTKKHCDNAANYFKEKISKTGGIDDVKVVSTFKPRGVAKSNIVESIITSNSDEWKKDLSGIGLDIMTTYPTDEKIRIKQLKKNIENNTSLAVKAFDSLAKRDTQANEHYDVIEKTSAIQLKDINDRQRKIDKKNFEHKKDYEKINLNKRELEVDEERERHRKTWQFYLIYLSIFIALTGVIIIGLKS